MYALSNAMSSISMSSSPDEDDSVSLVKISQKLSSELTDCSSSSIDLSEVSSSELNVTFLPVGVVLADVPAEPDDLSHSIYLVFFGGVLIFRRSTTKTKDQLQTCDYQECIIWNSTQGHCACASTAL